ncbi:hypothetical protein BJF78_32525 [Pseudonocardia sp. CNS-139]|nr:hypothetical protein BJF78_32525 [Pseudonocardia sp. CNS-139]
MSSPAEDAAERRPVVFRVSPLVILVALTLVVCATPFAFGAPFLWLIYLVPVGIIVWTVRVRTTVDGESVAVRRVLGGRRVPWTQISSLRLRDRGRVSAVLTDGAELPLPAVHIRDLPQLAAASGGRLRPGWRVT